MNMLNTFNFKRIVSNFLLSGALAALAVFAVSLVLPKSWQVSGRIVVFPSGQPASASQNLAEEVGNTAWIINSDTFQKNYFENFRSNFVGAKVVKDSSIVLVKFKSGEKDIQAIEDLIVRIPHQVNEYARDLYGGSPFKYKLVGEPEVSTGYVEPDLRKNSLWGFGGGAILYLLYWLFFGSFLAERGKIAEERKKISPEPEPISVSPAPMPSKPDLAKLAEKREKIPSPPITSEPIIEVSTQEEKKLFYPVDSAPDNLPVADAQDVSQAGYREPTDEEVKERLNKLMRGEL